MGSNEKPVYGRVVIKISGEALAGANGVGIDRDVLEQICKSLKRCWEAGVQIGIVVGGGNFWRGRSSERMDRSRADHIGMLATAMNSLAMADAFEQMSVPVRVQTALEMRSIAEPYIRNRAVRHMEKGRVVIFGCGTGNPFFSTDTAASLRAAEIGAEIMIKAMNEDGVYDKDPRKHSDAKLFDTVTMKEVMDRELAFMDTTATAMCKENKIPVCVLNITDPDNIYEVIMGKTIGTTLTV